jgi:predicted enzyme related to lactoylglutathione lyase
MDVRVQEVVFDCADPAALAQFWAQVLDARWGLVDPDWAVVDASPVMLGFQKVPEPKQSPKNRLHLDVEVGDAVAAAERAEALGAQRTGFARLGEDGNGFVVLRDPEGNEFCFVVDRDGGWDRVLRRAIDARQPVA